MGRFTARDPFEGFLTDPLSLAKYPYVHGNPVNATDPTGLFILSGESLRSVFEQSVRNVSNLLWQSSLRSVVRQIGTAIGTAGTTIGFVNIAHQVKLWLARSAVRQCVVAGNENCEPGIPVVFYGENYNGNRLEETTQHIHDAILGQGSTTDSYMGFPARLLPAVVQAYSTTPADHGPRQWYRSPLIYNCDEVERARYRRDNGVSGQCDEYPFYDVVQGGRGRYLAGLVSLRLLPREQASIQGGLMSEPNQRRAGVDSTNPFLSWYGVVPVPGHPESFWKDRSGRVFR
jgi:hypothetical protein